MTVTETAPIEVAPDVGSDESHAESAEDFYADAVQPDSGNAQSPEATPNGIVFIEHDDLFAPEPVNENLVVPELGIGAGPPVGFFGQGFAGKTIMTMSMGMSVALGRPAWGQFETKRGIWVHFDYEQGRRETKKRVQRLAAGFGATKDDLREWIKVAVYPDTNLTSAMALEHYVEAMSGATIATVDSLKQITPGVEENSSKMRDYMRVLSQASEATGCAVILIHHAGKTDPKKSRKEMGRGSSGIYDECQAVFVVTTDQGQANPDRSVTHEKDRELGRLVPGFDLRFVDMQSEPVELDAECLAAIGLDETHGLLGPPVLDREWQSAFGLEEMAALRVEYVSGDVAAATMSAAHVDRIVKYLADSGGSFEGTAKDLNQAVAMRRADFIRALAEAVKSGRVVAAKKSYSVGASIPEGEVP